MAPCYCKYLGCGGQDIPQRTQHEHEKKDRIAKVKASLARRAVVSQPSHATLPSRSQAHPPLLDPPPSRPRLLGHPPNPDDAVPMSISRPPTPLRGHTSFAQEELDMVEERGRRYEERQTLSLDRSDNIGDLAEVEEQDEDLSLEPGPSTHDPSVHTSTNNTESRGVDNWTSRRTYSIPGSLPLHTVPTADPRYPDENTPDPFFSPTTTRNTTTPSIDATTTPAPLYILYMLVAWLHTQCKLAWMACGTVLVVVSHILVAGKYKLKDGQQAPYVTLSSVLTNLGVEPEFQVLPVCPQCMEVYPNTRARDSKCDRCLSPLFKHTKTVNGRRDEDDNIVRPLLQFPRLSIEDQLRKILEIPGMEDELEHWRHVHQTLGKSNDMFDGRVAQEIKGSDGRPFFENPSPVGCTELRIGLVLGFDW
jgi:hypothetical protein